MTQADAFPEVESRPEEFPDERYTTQSTLHLCRLLSGVFKFDLDVAACSEAHHAPVFFSNEMELDGLLEFWWGNVWCNPPFSNIGAWVAKAHREFKTGRAESICMLLPANRTEQPWWQDLVEPALQARRPEFKAHFLPGRIKFGHPGNPEGKGVGSPPFGCVLLVWRRA